MKEITLKSSIIHDEYTEIANRMFDVPVSEESVSIIKNNIELPGEWNIGLIFGESGGGKTTLLKEFGGIKEFEWDASKSIISCLNNVTPDKAAEVLSAVGLSTVPAWLRPYHALSNGQKFRADLARALVENENGLILIDEFSSVVDRNVAKAASNAVQKYIRNNNKKIILAACHSDIIEWLRPDWVYNPTEALTRVFARGSLQRPEIRLQIFRCKYEAWELFKQFHYLSSDLNKAAKCFVVYWNNNPVAITCILAFPHAKLKNAWRESRTVVLPDYQGLGIGVKVSDYFGKIIKGGGGRWYSRTTHPAMIAYRMKHNELWRVSSKGKSAQSEFGPSSTKADSWKIDSRNCYSFEYIGPASSQEESRLFFDKPEEIKKRPSINKSLTFYSEFIKPIKNGIKRTTIRKNNHQNIKIGDFIDLVSGGVIKNVKIIRVAEFQISDNIIRINNIEMKDEKLERLIKMEGFNENEKFYSDIKNYIGDKKGVIFAWE